MTTSRRKARTVALQVLFEVDCTGHDLSVTLDRAIQTGMTMEGRSLARSIAEGVDTNRTRLDEIIAQHAPTWPVEQLSGIDRTILRIAIFEILMNNNSTPPKAAANEAVELSKAFGGEKIHRFINGVLGAVIGEASSEKRAPIPGRF